MESQKLDPKFKKMIESSENHYNDYSDKAKDFIWRKIHRQKSNSISKIWKPLTIAASILIILSLSLGFYNIRKQSNLTIASLNLQIEQLEEQNLAQIQKPVTESKIITIENEKIVHVPVIKHEIVEKIKYIHDTVVITQIVVEYKDKIIEEYDISKSEIAAVNSKGDNLISTEFILSDKTTIPKNKKEGFSINQFLKNRYGQTELSDSEPTTLMDLLPGL